MNVAIIWDLDEDEAGNVQHMAEHGIDKADVAHVFDHPVGSDTSDSSQRPMVLWIHLGRPLHHGHLRTDRRRHGVPSDRI